MAAVAAVVVNPAAAADPPEVAAEWEAAARAVVVVNPAVAAARVEEDKVVAADAHRVVEAEPARVVVDRAVAVVDVPLVVGVDKVVVGKVAEEAAVARVVAADLPAVVAEWEVEEAVAVNPAVAGAAETVNSLASSGASRVCGAPLFY